MRRSEAEGRDDEQKYKAVNYTGELFYQSGLVAAARLGLDVLQS